MLQKYVPFPPGNQAGIFIRALKDFLVFNCADIEFLKNWSPKALNLVQNGNFSVLSLFCWPFLLPWQW